MQPVNFDGITCGNGNPAVMERPQKQRSIKQSATDAVDDERLGGDKDGLAKDGWMGG